MKVFLVVNSALSGSKFGKCLTPPPLKNVNVLNGWSLKGVGCSYQKRHDHDGVVVCANNFVC